MHPVLRIGIEGAKARGRVAFALIGLFAAELQASLFRLFLYGAALAAMALGAVEVVSRAMPLSERDGAGDWIEVNKPFPAFALTIQDFEAAPRYAVWRHASAGGRKDVLTFIELGGASAVVEIHRLGPDSSDPDESTASIPELRLSGPSGERAIETKFGAVTVEPFTDDAPTGQRACLHFSRDFDEPRLALTGWFCNPGVELVDRGMIACALDRLSLLAAGSEPKLAALFARAELRRGFCGQRSVFLAATPKPRDWIEAARDPKLRGSAADF